MSYTPFSAPRSSLRTKAFYVPIALFVTLLFFVFTPLPTQYDSHRDALVHHISDTATSHILSISEAHPHTQNLGLANDTLHTPKPKFAFATFLAGTDEAVPDGQDNYFIAVRILAYQFLHAPETRSVDRSIPFIVLVTDKVPEHQRARLRRDGATVVVAPYLRSQWIKAAISGWDDVLTKLRLWELTVYERICFVDADMELLAPLDGVFYDPAVQTQHTRGIASEIKSDEAPLPATFSFAGIPEMFQEHSFPPTDEAHDFPNANYLNAGFFVFAPSMEVLAYYQSVLSIADRFDSSLPEQNLLNYAHRRDGNMPWTTLNNMWNIHYPTEKDVMGGVRSIHEKWWAPGPGLEGLMFSWRWRMEGFFESRDSIMEGQKGNKAQHPRRRRAMWR